MLAAWYLTDEIALMSLRVFPTTISELFSKYRKKRRTLNRQDVETTSRICHRQAADGVDDVWEALIAWTGFGDSQLLCLPRLVRVESHHLGLRSRSDPWSQMLSTSSGTAQSQRSCNRAVSNPTTMIVP